MLNSPAPDFSLDSSTGQKIKLADLRGSYVVLIFYPMNDSPTCNRQLSDMNINLDEFLAHNTRVFGVNTADKEKARAYCERRKLEYPILSDPGAVVAKQYGASWLKLLVRRTVVAICPQGLICFHQAGKPDPAVVLEAIKENGRSKAGNTV